jgi:hypothetical protein
MYQLMIQYSVTLKSIRFLTRVVFEMNITNLDKMTFIIGKIELLRALRAENEAALLETNILPQAVTQLATSLPDSAVNLECLNASASASLLLNIGNVLMNPSNRNPEKTKLTPAAQNLCKLIQTAKAKSSTDAANTQAKNRIEKQRLSNQRNLKMMLGTWILRRPEDQHLGISKCALHAITLLSTMKRLTKNMKMISKREIVSTRKSLAAQMLERRKSESKRLKE